MTRPATPEAIRQACAFVEAEGTWGTQTGAGYLVRPEWAVTCAHVVHGVALGARLRLRFPSCEVEATVRHVDPEADCAMMQLDQPLPDVEPLTLSTGLVKGSVWEAHGFPAQVQPIEGHVQDPDGLDLRRGPAVVLHARNTPPGALEAMLSGVPIFSSDQVIGHLKQVVPDERTGRTGVVYACPARYIESLLPPDPQKRHPQPPKAAYDPSWYVHRQAEEQMAQDYLEFPGKPAVLWGPELFGKTWLLKYVLNERRKPSEGRCKVVSVNLELFDQRSKSSLSSFLRELAMHVVNSFHGHRDEVEQAWVSDNPMSNITWLMERSILPRMDHNDGVVLLAIDRADTVWDSPFASEFFGLLRAWAENGVEEEPWQRLRLLLSVSTTPALLIHNARQSPFNLTEPVRLGDFDQDQTLRLAQLYGLRPSAAELDAVRALIGGHPYLLRLLFYSSRKQGAPLLQLLDEDPKKSKVFDGFLDQALQRLQEQPAVGGAFTALLTGPPSRLSSLDRNARHKLEQAGLIESDEATSGFRVRYQLYQRLRRKLTGT